LTGSIANLVVSSDIPLALRDLGVVCPRVCRVDSPLVDAVLEYGRLHRILRQDFAQGTVSIRLAINASAFPLVDREHTLKLLCDAMDRRFRQRRASFAPKESRMNPLFVTQCPPGGGKSFLLDCLADGSASLPRYNDSQSIAGEFMSHAIRVNITFNGGQRSPLAPLKDSLQIAYRILHS